MSSNKFDKNFDYGSFLPLVLYIFGIYSIYLILLEEYSQGFIIMLISFAIYVLNNIFINFWGFTTVFNEYLEDTASFVAFALPIILFGIMIYKESPIILIPVFFYAICTVLSVSRNWILRLKNSLGWPLSLNGVFFPLIYYTYSIYLNKSGESIFIIYFLAIGYLAISEYNFLGYTENNKDRYRIMDKRVFEKNKDEIMNKEEEKTDKQKITQQEQQELELHKKEKEETTKKQEKEIIKNENKINKHIEEAINKKNPTKTTKTKKKFFKNPFKRNKNKTKITELNKEISKTYEKTKEEIPINHNTNEELKTSIPQENGFEEYIDDIETDNQNNNNNNNSNKINETIIEQTYTKEKEENENNKKVEEETDEERKKKMISNINSILSKELEKNN